MPAAAFFKAPIIKMCGRPPAGRPRSTVLLPPGRRRNHRCAPDFAEKSRFFIAPELAKPRKSVIVNMLKAQASVAQSVEHHVANVIVAGSIPVTRSSFLIPSLLPELLFPQVPPVSFGCDVAVVSPAESASPYNRKISYFFSPSSLAIITKPCYFFLRFIQQIHKKKAAIEAAWRTFRGKSPAEVLYQNL